VETEIREGRIAKAKGRRKEKGSRKKIRRKNPRKK